VHQSWEVELSTHESFDRGTGVKSASDRSFGLVMAAFFALVGALTLLRDPPSVRWWAVGIAAIFLLLALWWQALLATPNRVWLKVALLLHRIVSPVILAVMFYGTVVPIGLIMRAIGKNPLRMQRDPAAASYWIAREPGRPPESMKNQF
jgi:hypothetical protein